MIGKIKVARDEGGSTVVEAGLALPLIVAVVYGIFQISLLYYANAGMQHALGEGARFATLYATNRTISVTTNGVSANRVVNYPTTNAVQSRMTATLFGESDGSYNVIAPAGGTSNAGVTGLDEWYELEVRYTRKMNFLFINGPSVTLVRKKRVYLAAS